jgi:hypothetical protein
MNENVRSHSFIKVKNRDFKKDKIITRILLIVLLLFFGLQFLSHTFLVIGKNTPDFKNIKFLKLSSHFLPIDAKPLLEYGFVLLKKNQQSPDSRVLEKSISYLKKSISRNMLDYNAHLYLGKAYYFRNMTDHTSFDQAMASLKRAAQIRGSHIEVSMDTMKVLLSMWPFLQKEDKTFCGELLKKSIKKMKKEDFNSLLEIWSLYSRDVDFFKDALKKEPRYYLAAAEKLLHLEMDMKTRHDFLSKYAAYLLAKIQNQYHTYLEEDPVDLLEKLKKLANNLNRQTTIASYYLINQDKKWKQKNYVELIKDLNLNILKLLFAKKEWQKESRQRSEINTFIHSFIKDLSTIDELTTFNDFLIKKKYLDLHRQDLRVFYIKQLIQFKSGQYDSVILDTEKLLDSISYIKKERMKDYNDILLLRTDAYIASRLLTRAMSVLKEVEKNDSNRNEVYWREMQIERVIGADAEEEMDKQKERQYEFIRNSSRIELNSLAVERALYLIDNNKQVEIQFNPSIKEKIKSSHLLQVFIDGKLFHEAYLSKLELPVKLNIPTEETYSKHTIKIKII